MIILNCNNDFSEVDIFWLFEHKRRMQMIFSKRKKVSNSNGLHLVIITGCAGSGKTTVGKELAKQLSFAYIDKDTVKRIYRFYCREVLENGSSVVVTIPFISQIKDWSSWIAIKNEARIDDSVDTRFIWIKHDIDTEKKNITKRNAIRDKYKLEHWDEYARSVDGIEPAPEYNIYEYNNDCDAKLTETLEEVKQWIGK